MDIILVALISLASFFGLLFLAQLSRWIFKYSRRVIFLIYKWIAYRLVWRRPNGSSNVTVFTLISLLALVALNTFALIFRASTARDISNRAANMFLINLIPVTLGDGSSILTERLLGLYHRQLGAFHRWLWRICFVNGLVHTVIQLRVSTLHWTLVEIIVSQTKHIQGKR